MMNWWSSIYQFFFLLKIMLLISENSLPNPRSQMFSPVSSTSSIGLHFTFRTMIHFVVNFVYDTEYVRSLFSFYLANICRIVSITHALIQSTWVCNLGLTYSHLHTAWTQEVAFAPHSHTRGDCASQEVPSDWDQICTVFPASRLWKRSYTIFLGLGLTIWTWQ